MTDAAVRVLPTSSAEGAAQMAVDDGLLDDARVATARRYLWAPPALSLGKFQAGDGRVEVGKARGGTGGLPFEVVRRPSGGRAVLHGEGFEWSFAVVFPAGSLPGPRVDDAYEVVSMLWAETLAAAGVRLDTRREEPYRRSALCFATSLRHDLLAEAQKIVAVAQVKRRGAALVHGSVLERRPPAQLVAAVEHLLGEPWRGEGLAAAGVSLDGDALWADFCARLASRVATSPPAATGATAPHTRATLEAP